MKVTKEVTITNKLGLHTRPATVIAKLLEKSRSKVSFNCNRQTIDPRSTMNILLLGAAKGTKVTITANGSDAADTVDNLIHAFDTQFGE